MRSTTGKFLVTGAGGFVGTRLVAMLAKQGEVLCAVRRAPEMNNGAGRWFETGELTAHVNWGPGLQGVNTVIHTAARVHQMHDRDSPEAYRRINVEATLNLARQSAAAGVTRFIYISSVKVLGEVTQVDRPFLAEDTPAPKGAYAESKAEAEGCLQVLARHTGMESVIIRPVLVYGPGVRANFQALMRWLWRGVPLPLGAVKNLRSFVGIDNLVDLITTCVHHPGAGNQVFMVSDGEDLSTPELLRRVGEALRKPARLLPVPPWILRSAASILGRGEAVNRLCASLRVDIGKNLRVLGWRPPVEVNEGIDRTVRGFLGETGH